MSRAANERRGSWGMGLLAIVAGGCFSNSTGEPDNDTTNSDAGTPTGVQVMGRVEQFALNTSRQQLGPVEDVTVCVFDSTQDCFLTDENGQFVLPGVPRNQEVTLSFTKDGWIPTVRHIETESESTSLLAQTVMGRGDVASELSEDVGIEPLPDTGGVQFFAMQPGDGVFQLREVAGYQVEIAPKSDDVVIVYLDENGKPDPSLNAATSRGIGLIGNLPPGEHTLRFTHPELECTERLPESGWEAEEPNAVRFEVYENHLTAQIGVICQSPESDG